MWTGREVSAADNTNNAATSSTTAPATNRDNLAQDLSQKLGVDKDKVQTALDDVRKEHQEERKKEVSANLDQAVKDGVITADQKQKILDHQAQMQTARQKQRSDNEQWAKDNGIDMSKLKSYLGGFGHRGARRN